MQRGWYDRTQRRVRDLACGDLRISLDVEVRRVACRRCGQVKQARLAFRADHPCSTKRFAFVMDLWTPFRLSTARPAPQASLLFDTFHVLRHLGAALAHVRKSEDARVSGRQRRVIKGQTDTVLAHRETLTLSGRRALKTLLAANTRLNTASLLKESCAHGFAWPLEWDRLVIVKAWQPFTRGAHEKRAVNA